VEDRDVYAQASLDDAPRPDDKTMTTKLENLLGRLDRSRRNFDKDDSELRAVLESLSKSNFPDASSLIRFHEALLSIRAYPPSARVAKQADQLLKQFDLRISKLSEDADLSPLDAPEVSGIAGGTVTSNFSYAIVRWLAAKYPAQISIDWDWFEEEDRFGAVIPRLIPLLGDDAMVEAHVPFREWLDAARGRQRELTWLIRHFESLPLPPKEKANLYDSLKLHVTWQYGRRSSRTRMRVAAGKLFIHNSPLIARRDISLARELSSPSIPIEKLSRAAGEKILDIARETSAVRYRELHGFTYGDPHRVLKAEIGRGTVVYLTGVPPQHRLPLRAYHAAMMFKNGVPVGYFEGLSIAERIESGFNLYYTFRDGETAWLYARILRLMRQIAGVTVFSIDPYQIGHENEEGIESGAFWFYRKLGFRSVKPDLLELTEREETKVASDSRYRTSAATLRRLAAGHMLFDLSAVGRTSPWDDFEVRNVGLAVARRMGRDYAGDAEALRADSVKIVSRALGVNTRGWSDAELTALQNLSLMLAAIKDPRAWTAEQKRSAVSIIRAKAARDESDYLKLMQKHAAFRDVLMRLGCR
jgi:hypothetical protein